MNPARARPGSGPGVSTGATGVRACDRRVIQAGGQRVRQLRHDVPPASWTIVMASGVVSIDLSRDHQAVLSAIMAWFAALVWLFLAVTLAAPLAYQRGRFRRESG